MSLKPTLIQPVPEATAHVARAACEAGFAEVRHERYVLGEEGWRTERAG